MDEFLQDEETNFIYIATPNLLHYEQVKRALIAGKNVICEKPFCTKASQARELIELAEEKGLILVDAVPPAFLPNMEILNQYFLYLIFCGKFVFFYAIGNTKDSPCYLP